MPLTLNDTPDNMISTVKSILYVIATRLPPASNFSNDRSRLATRGLQLHVTGILFFYGRRPSSKQAGTGDAAPRLLSERHRKKRTFFPS
jgi:hypothetical protein